MPQILFDDIPIAIFMVLVPVESRKEHHSMAEDYWNNAIAKRIGTGRDLLGLKKDGTTEYA